MKEDIHTVSAVQPTDTRSDAIDFERGRFKIAVGVLFTLCAVTILHSAAMVLLAVLKMEIPPALTSFAGVSMGALVMYFRNSVERH